MPAHSISTTQIDIDEDYHQLSDEIETLDITNITNTAKLLGVTRPTLYTLFNKYDIESHGH